MVRQREQFGRRRNCSRQSGQEGVKMEIGNAEKNQWIQIREIYLEAFPKAERKPFFTVKHGVARGKAQLLVAVERDVLAGFVMVIPYRDMVMVDYLAVSGQIRSQGTGSKILKEVCRRFPGKRLVLLIEKPDVAAPNREQRIARRNFYLKNGFTPASIAIDGYSGEMEVLSYGGQVSPQEYLDLQRYALGGMMFRLSKIRLATKK